MQSRMTGRGRAAVAVAAGIGLTGFAGCSGDEAAAEDPRPVRAATVENTPTPHANADSASGGDPSRVFPLTAQADGGWWPIRAGVELAEADGLRVRYLRERGKPAGTAMPIAAGTLRDFKALRIDLGREANSAVSGDERLSVCLTDSDGVVWTLPTVKPAPDQNVRELAFADIRPDPFQNAGKRPGEFDAASVTMITILDIGGFMNAPESEVAWTLRQFEGVPR